MTLYVLDNDVNFKATRMRAGKVIDSNLFNVAALQAAGARLVPATTVALARAGALTKIHRGGQSPDMQVAVLVPDVQPATSPPSGGAQPVRVTAAQSPYSMPANTSAIVDCSGGNVVINLQALNPGDSVTVKHDESTALNGNVITVNANGAQTLSQPPPAAAGTFAAFVTIAGAIQAGTSLTWINDGSAGGALVSV